MTKNVQKCPFSNTVISNRSGLVFCGMLLLWSQPFWKQFITNIYWYDFIRQMIYRTNGIKGRTFIRAALFSKTWFLLSKIWTKISSNLIEAAATNSVSTVIRIWFSSKKGLNSWGSLIYLKTCHFLLISCLICKCVLTLEVDFTRREQRLTK